MACELYCCLLPQCEALRICRSGFPIATLVCRKRNCSHHTFVQQSFCFASCFIYQNCSWHWQ